VNLDNSRNAAGKTDTIRIVEAFRSAEKKPDWKTSMLSSAFMEAVRFQILHKGLWSMDTWRTPLKLVNGGRKVDARVQVAPSVVRMFLEPVYFGLKTVETVDFAVHPVGPPR
jgi:hypothetical protein